MISTRNTPPPESRAFGVPLFTEIRYHMVKFCSRPGALTGGRPELLPSAGITVSKGLRGHGFEMIMPRPIDIGDVFHQIK